MFVVATTRKQIRQTIFIFQIKVVVQRWSAFHKRKSLYIYATKIATFLVISQTFYKKNLNDLRDLVVAINSFLIKIQPTLNAYTDHTICYHVHVTRILFISNLQQYGYAVH